MRGAEHSIEESWLTDTVLLCLVQSHNYAGCRCWNASLWVSSFLSFSFPIQQFSFCLFSLPFHTNLIGFISIFSSHIFPFSSFICLIPLLISCHSPHFLSIAFVSLALSKLRIPPKAPFINIYLTLRWWDSPEGGDHSWQIISKSCTESVSHTRKGALGWPTWFLSSDAAD